MKQLRLISFFSDGISDGIIVSIEEWSQIKNGESFSETSEYWYDGESFDSFWEFKNGLFSISGSEGRQCVVESPISELSIEELEMNFTLSEDSLPFSFFDEVQFSYEQSVIESIQEKYSDLTIEECTEVYNSNYDIIDEVVFQMSSESSILGYQVGESEVDESTGTWGYFEYEISDFNLIKTELDTDLKSLMRDFLKDKNLNEEGILE